ncbi:MAG: urease accessory protein UreF [Rikenellaceae bacterium]
MTIDKLTTLLHLSDPTLPIGGYAHSYGLESYVQRGAVSSVESAKEFVANSLRHNLKYNDGLYVRLAWEAARGGDFAALDVFDEECSAIKSPVEIRTASLKLGVRLLKIFNRNLSGEGVEALTRLTKRPNGGGHYPIIYGSVAALAGLELSETLLSFYYNSMVCMVTNAVKLIPLGQLSGQDIIFELERELGGVVDETMELDPNMRGVCAVGFDIAAMQHERLYSRLYMS